MGIDSPAPTEYVRRYAHLEQDIVPDPATDSLLFPTAPRLRWACDYCRALRRASHGKWTVSEELANDQADAHDEIHASEQARTRSERPTAA